MAPTTLGKTMSLEKDIKGIMEADVFKGASREEWSKRQVGMPDKYQKKDIVRQVEKALEAQFSGYSWDDMLKDALIDYTPKELNWARDHISYKAYVYDDPDFISESTSQLGNALKKEAGIMKMDLVRNPDTDEWELRSKEDNKVVVSGSLSTIKGYIKGYYNPKVNEADIFKPASQREMDKRRGREWKGIHHDFQCQGCGKPATVNLQQNWHRWYITPNGDFTAEKEWEGDTNEMWCDKCYEKEMSIEG